MYSGPVIDCHVHLHLDDGMLMDGRAHEPKHYLDLMGDVDLRQVGVLVMAPPDDLERTRRQNDLVLDLAADDGPWYAMCSVHPHDGAAALAEVDRVAEAGARGLKLHPNTQAFDVADEGVAAVVARAAEHDLPVLFDAYSPFDGDQPGKFVTLAMACPDARLVLAHMHGPRFPDLVVHAVLAEYEWWPRNVWCDVSWASDRWADSPFAKQFAWTCRQVGMDRILFGSDFPLVDPVVALASLDRFDFTPEELAAVAHGNAASLFGFEDR
jgi:predicted TIM-barrel fold metal-dependent hydrolase